MSTAPSEQVYVRLLDEGTEVFRPVRAHRLGKGVYEIDREQPYDSDGEAWEFPPGSQVRLETRTLQNGPVKVAIDTEDSAPDES